MKITNDEAYQKFKERVLKAGFKYVFFYWEDKNKDKYIIDGHHRKKFLLKMEDEGIIIPEFYPALKIDAKNKKDAAKELLYLNSTYGEITKEGLIKYFKAFEIKKIEIKNIEIQLLNEYSKEELNFQPDDKDQPRLDKINVKVCPKCGYEFN